VFEFAEIIAMAHYTYNIEEIAVPSNKTLTLRIAFRHGNLSGDEWRLVISLLIQSSCEFPSTGSSFRKFKVRRDGVKHNEAGVQRSLSSLGRAN
jgi:hypothetical protein